MARPFMFADLCQRAHPLKHSLAESIFVSRVQKHRKNIRQPKHSLAGSLVSRGITVQTSEISFLVNLHLHNVTTQLTEVITVAARTAPSLIKERNLKTKYSTQRNYGTLALKTSQSFCTSSSSLFVLFPPSSFMKRVNMKKGSIAENYNL